jgi:hypothetical protein
VIPPPSVDFFEWLRTTKRSADTSPLNLHGIEAMVCGQNAYS